MKKKKTKKINKTNLYILSFFLILFLVVASILIIPKSLKEKEDKKKQEELLNEYKSKRIDEIQTEEKTRKEVNDFINLVYSDNSSIEDIEKVTNTDLVNYNIYYGADSYFRNLGKGVSNTKEINILRDINVNKLEKTMKENFEIELLDYIVTIDDAVVQRVKYKGFYYTEFMKDYHMIFDKLVSYTEYKDLTDESNINSTKAFNDMYKLEVKALEIMCSHLDNYVNKDEYVTYDLVYRKGETKVENEYLSLYMFLGGHLYEHKSLPENERGERVTSMIKEAIDDGTLDVSNPFNLD